MADRLAHRGPDGGGEFVAAGVGLASRRLAIIDLEHGDQPIASEDGQVVAVGNGEIYNHLELRRELEKRGHRFAGGSDIEVVVHLYEERGDTLLEALRGMFALAIWDRRRRRLLLARDRLGIKPLLYAETPDALAFASEAKGLLASGALEPRLDAGALAGLLRARVATPPRPPLVGVRSLPPGHLLSWERGRASVERYWDLAFPERGSDGGPDDPRSRAGWAEALRAKLDETTRLHLRSDVRVGAVLSTGLDSSAIAALARDARGGAAARDPLATFSIGLEEPAYGELGAGTLATLEPQGLCPHTARCSAEDFRLLPALVHANEGLWLGGVGIVRLRIARMIREAGLVVAVAGEGADEVLGGYDWYRIIRLRPLLAALPRPLRTGLARVLRGRRPGLAQVLADDEAVSLATFRTLCSGPSDPRVARILDADLARALPAPAAGLTPAPPGGFARWHPFCQLQYLEMKTRLLAINASVDATSMAHGVEMRVPFLDHELVELCARMPVGVRMRGTREKDVLRHAMAGRLPAAVLRRRKRGLMAPTSEWLRGRLPDFAGELLDAPALRASGVFDAAGVDALLREHRGGSADHGALLWAVLCIQVFEQLFVRGRPLAAFA